MITTVQTKDHQLMPIKGWYPFISLDKTLPLDEEHMQSLSQWPRGRVGYIHSNGKFRLANGANLTYQMPFYLWQGGDDLDVIAQGVGVDGKLQWANGLPAGTMTGLAATGGYEIQTTEFDANQTYAPNTFLTAGVDGNGDPGVLTPINGGIAANWVCGVASVHCNERWDQQTVPTSAKGVNAVGKNVLTFYTYFLPKLS